MWGIVDRKAGGLADARHIDRNFLSASRRTRKTNESNTFLFILKIFYRDVF